MIIIDFTHADCENGNAISTEFSSSSFWLKSSSSLAVRHDNEHARNRRRQWASTVLYVQHLIPNKLKSKRHLCHPSIVWNVRVDGIAEIGVNEVRVQRYAKIGQRVKGCYTDARIAVMRPDSLAPGNVRDKR